MQSNRNRWPNILFCGAVVLGCLAYAETVAASTTYYVDSVAGQNTNAGTSLEAAWRDFTHINGRTLDAGDQLLIKRGSVINQELQVSARGTADKWVEIGVYGTGPRPIIRRNWDIADRCVLIRDPDYLRVRSLVVTCAAKGLVVTYTQPGHAGLLIEDCIAYHIEGLYRPNSSGIPEWRDRPGPQGDGSDVSGGIAVTGAPGRNITIRDCEMFHTSWGFFVLGDDITLDRNSRFIKNNWANKLGPGEIYIWGKSQPQDPQVCCSNGTIHKNGYVLLPGVEFFVNEAPTLTKWSLQDNVQYSSVEELDKALPLNNPPVVDAGLDLYSDQTTVQLAGVVRDDDRPAVGSLKTRWEVVEGAAAVTFEDATSLTTKTTFAIPGDYLLRLVGDDGELTISLHRHTRRAARCHRDRRRASDHGYSLCKGIL
ncbi:MAG: hypothetical protein ACYC3X_17855 [Pirellulaceae bacterium]